MGGSSQTSIRFFPITTMPFCIKCCPQFEQNTQQRVGNIAAKIAMQSQLDNDRSLVGQWDPVSGHQSPLKTMPDKEFGLSPASPIGVGQVRYTILGAYLYRFRQQGVIHILISVLELGNDKARICKSAFGIDQLHKAHQLAIVICSNKFAL